MASTNRLTDLLNNILVKKRKAIIVIFLMLLALNVLFIIFFAIKDEIKSAVGISILYGLNSLFFYALPMFIAPIMIRYYDRRARKPVIFLRMITFGLMLLMIFGQVGWLQFLLAQITKG